MKRVNEQVWGKCYLAALQGCSTAAASFNSPGEIAVAAVMIADAAEKAWRIKGLMIPEVAT